MATSGTFVRKASGLVREVTGFDTLAYNIFVISLGYMLFIVMYWVLYPGADMALAVVITTVLAVFQALTYALLSAAYPRSGGDYVYITRILHPALGFVMSFQIYIWLEFYLALNSGMAGFQGIAPLLSGVGFVTHNESLISMGTWAGTPVAYFSVGVLALTFYAVLLMSGAKNYFTFQKAIFAIAISTAVLTLVLLATTSHEAFVARFNSLAAPYSNSTDTYSAMIKIAAENGYSGGVPFSLTQTFLFFVWPWLAVGYCMLSSSFSGEIKGVRKGQITGMLGAALITGVVFVLLAVLAGRAFGYDFLGAATYLMFIAPTSLPIPVAPWYSLFTAILTDNVILSAIILVGWFSWFLVLAAAAFVFVSRTSFAWAMDGMLPKAFSYVSEKRRTPINTILLCFVGGVLFLAGIAFTPWLGVLSGTLGVALVWLATSISGAVYPFRRQEFYRRSGVNWEVGRIPLISIVSVVNIATVLVLLYIMITDSRAFANSPSSVGMVLIFLVVGVLLFYAMKYIRKRQGVDLDLVFREIPVE
jgi:amino acid transporter